MPNASAETRLDREFEKFEITPRELQQRIERGHKVLLVDVREKWEYDVARIGDATLIPLREIPEHLPELQAAGEIVLFCHHGVRTLDAAIWLRSHDVQSAVSMAGGIDRWSTEIDPRVARY